MTYVAEIPEMVFSFLWIKPLLWMVNMALGQLLWGTGFDASIDFVQGISR